MRIFCQQMSINVNKKLYFALFWGFCHFFAFLQNKNMTIMYCKKNADFCGFFRIFFVNKCNIIFLKKFQKVWKKIMVRRFSWLNLWMPHLNHVTLLKMWKFYFFSIKAWPTQKWTFINVLFPKKSWKYFSKKNTQ